MDFRGNVYTNDFGVPDNGFRLPSFSNFPPHPHSPFVALSLPIIIRALFRHDKIIFKHKTFYEIFFLFSPFRRNIDARFMAVTCLIMSFNGPIYIYIYSYV